MRGDDVIYYQFDADQHCIECPGADFCWDCHTDFTYREEDDDA
jgi:hypothetical protein